jgi:iron(III) transport system ATP-binding protein
MRAASISFRGVTKRYGDVIAVDDVSFDIAAGTLVTLLGPSGCGKTTVLRMMAGLETPVAGVVRIGERDVTAIGAPERDVSMVFQSYALFPHLSVLENVRYGLVVTGVPKTSANERARLALATVGLTALDSRLPSELSGGQQQRVAVARALVLEPSVLLFDEPLSNLDARLRRQMRDEIRDLQRRLGLTVVYVTHDQVEALAVSDRIIVMDAGRIAQAGTPRALYEAPENAFVAGFIGEANRVQGTLSRINDANGDIVVGPLRFTLPHRGMPDGQVELAIRPEAIRLGTRVDSALAATVRKATYVGAAIEYLLDTEAGTLFATSPDTGEVFTPGTGIGITFNPRGVVVVPR